MIDTDYPDWIEGAAIEETPPAGTTVLPPLTDRDIDTMIEGDAL